MTKRISQGWRVPSFRMFAVAGLCLCLGSPRGRADGPRAQIRGAPPPPPSVKRSGGTPSQPAPAPADRPLPSSSRTRAGSTEPPLDAAGIARLATIRTALNPLLIRDRRHRLLLLRGGDALQNGSALDGMAHLQALLNAPQDAFVWTGQSARPRGAQADVVRQLRSLPLSVRRSCERHHGPEARELLNRYHDSHDQRLLFELCRRFGYTAAVRDAAVYELLSARDAGREALAAEWGRVLLADAHHWNQLNPAMRKLVSGHIASTQTPRIGPGRSAATPSPTRTAIVTASHRALADVATSPPYPIPLWTARFDATIEPPHPTSQTEERSNEISGIIRDAFDEWLADRIDRRLPIASANEAVIADNTLIVRDFAQVRAFDLASGEIRWTFRCAASLATAAARHLGQQGNKTRAGELDFDAVFSGNPVFGRLTTDGNRLFLLDRTAPPATDLHQQSVNEGRTTYKSTSARSRGPNRLVALPVKPRPNARGSASETATVTATGAATANEPLWSRGAESSLPNDHLAAHVFLGRPLCVDDRVFVLAEGEQQISLLALEAATGRTLWMQGVALLNQSAAADSLRARTACTPLYSEGIVACSTEVGVVVGVDALTGRLQWVYDHLDEEQRANSGRWAFSNGRKTDRLPLPSHSYVRCGCLFHLPRRSAYVHCIDLKTGTGLWTKPRLGSYAIGGVTDTMVLLLGDRECRALGLNDGRQLWRTTTPEPAGIGIATGNRYLLPTSGGPCLTINLNNGKIEGQRFSRLVHEVAATSVGDGPRSADVVFGSAEGGTAATVTANAGSTDSGSGETEAADAETAQLIRTLRTSPSGNLLACGDLIVATTPLGLSVFAQARPALEHLRSASPGALSNADFLKQAQLLLTLGNDDSAGRTLANLLNSPVDADIRVPAERLLREILFAQLEHADDPYSLLDRIALLARNDEQRLRLLLSRVDVALKFEDAQLLVDAVDRLQALPPTGLLAIDGDNYQACPRQCLWERLSRLQDNGPPELQEALARYLAAKASSLRDSWQTEDLEQFVALFAGWEPATDPRIRLARMWIDAGRNQEAELLLLCDRFRSTPDAAGNVRQQLGELYVQQGLATGPMPPLIAAFGLDERALLRGADGDRPHQGSGISLIGTALVALAPISPPARLQWTAFGPPPATRHVQIAEHAYEDTCAHTEACTCDEVRKLHDKALRRFIPKQTGNLIVLNRRVAGNDKTASRLVIADRDRGLVRGEIEVPAAYWHPPRPLTAETGHVMVIGGESAFGLSLLEGKLLWSFRPKHPHGKRDKIKVGPIGSDFCVLQTSRELRVVHPATGQTLWLRTHLPPGTGLLENDSAGVIGDSRTLAVFDAGQMAFTLYETQSGRELGRGTRKQIAGSNQRGRWAVGRRLVELVSDATGSRLNVWDSRDNRIEFDIPLHERLMCPLPNGRDFAFVTAGGRLQILDAQSGRLHIDLLIPAADGDASASLEAVDARGLVAFSDPSRFYVNLIAEADRGDTASVAAADHLAFPNVRVRGRLLAVGRRDQTIVWDRSVADACVPLRPDCALPMLVLVRQSRDASAHKTRPSKEQGQRLMIDVLDAGTGTTLRSHDDLDLIQFIDCPVTHLTDAAGRPLGTRLSLAGLHSRVDVTVGPPAGGPLLRAVSRQRPTTEQSTVER